MNTLQYIPGPNSEKLFGNEVAWDYLKSVLDAADPKTGAISIERTPSNGGAKVTQTQPPLLSWSGLLSLLLLLLLLFYRSIIYFLNI